jgi:hypothetical protein
MNAEKQRKSGHALNQTSRDVIRVSAFEICSPRSEHRRVHDRHRGSPMRCPSPCGIDARGNFLHSGATFTRSHLSERMKVQVHSAPDPKAGRRPPEANGRVRTDAVASGAPCNYLSAKDIYHNRNTQARAMSRSRLPIRINDEPSAGGHGRRVGRRLPLRVVESTMALGVAVACRACATGQDGKVREAILFRATSTELTRGPGAASGRNLGDRPAWVSSRWTVTR